MNSLSIRRVLLIGAGGHAKVCIEALQDMGDTVVVGALSTDGTGVKGLGIPVLGMQEDLEKVTQSRAVTAICVAIGRNRDRQRISTMLTQSGHALTRAISRFSAVSDSATLSTGVQLLAGAIVNAGTVVGDGAIVNTNAAVDHDCAVGQYVHVGPGSTIGGGVTLGEAAFVGMGARVLPGIDIGAESTVGAGAVVIDDVAPGATVVGVPARRIDRAEQS